MRRYPPTVEDPVISDECRECGGKEGAHYGSCSQIPASMRTVFDSLDREAEERRREEASKRVVIPVHRPGTVLAAARAQVRKIAKGATINGTYRLSPQSALEAFRADLLLILGDE